MVTTPRRAIASAKWTARSLRGKSPAPSSKIMAACRPLSAGWKINESTVPVAYADVRVSRVGAAISANGSTAADGNNAGNKSRVWTATRAGCHKASTATTTTIPKTSPRLIAWRVAYRHIFRRWDTCNEC